MSSFLLNYVYNYLLTYSYGNSMLNILRNLQLVFYSNSTILQFATSESISPYSHQNLLLSIFLIMALLVGMKW